MRILFFGTPEFALPSLRRLLEDGHDVPAVVTQPDRMKGRGHAMSEPPVKRYAKQQGIVVLQPVTIRSSGFSEHISSFTPELIVVVAYGKIIPPDILALPRLGCLNVHASLLPRYRGAAPIHWAIINGEAETGVTTMMMDEGLDTGEILLMDKTAIRDDDTAETLGARLSVMGGDLLSKTIDGLAAGSLSPLPQKGGATYAPILRKEDGRIRWNQTARAIFNLMRGTYPWPGAYCYIRGERLVLLKASFEGERTGGFAGRIEKIVGDDIHVGTSGGILIVARVKPDGKKEMSAAAFARGRKLKEGDYFEEHL